MVRRLSRAISLVRDLVVALLSLIIAGSQYQRLAVEPVFYLTVSVSVILVVLCMVDALLVISKKGRGALGVIGWFQVVLGLFWAGLFLPIGLIIIVLNVAVLLSLRSRRTAEEMSRHPPVVRTKRYKVAVAAGAMLMVLSLPLPWFAGSGSTVSLLEVYTILTTHSRSLPSVSVGPTGAAFALLAVAGTPPALLFGTFGLRWRRLALLGGTLAAVSGGGLVLALPGAGIGAYSLAAGGILDSIAFFLFRGRWRSDGREEGSLSVADKTNEASD